jgi:uncharacterized OsmC-like protein
MGMKDIAVALERVRSVLARKPSLGMHDDAPATARWESGTRVVASHASGARMETDMPVELGGSGDRVPPGWLFRAGIASCTATSIAMRAALDGIDIGSLEVTVESRSDARGMLGMADEDGAIVGSGPCDLRMNVRIAAPGVTASRLRELVENARACSPIPTAVHGGTPIPLSVDVQER